MTGPILGDGYLTKAETKKYTQLKSECIFILEILSGRLSIRVFSVKKRAILLDTVYTKIGSYQTAHIN